MCFKQFFINNGDWFTSSFILQIWNTPFFDRDDTPHVPNEDLGERAVLDIIGNLTQIINQVFPGKCEPAVEH